MLSSIWWSFQDFFPCHYGLITTIFFQSAKFIKGYWSNKGETYIEIVWAQRLSPGLFHRTTWLSLNFYQLCWYISTFPINPITLLGSQIILRLLKRSLMLIISKAVLRSKLAIKTNLLQSTCLAMIVLQD